MNKLFSNILIFAFFNCKHVNKPKYFSAKTLSKHLIGDLEINTLYVGTEYVISLITVDLVIIDNKVLRLNKF